ncbi:MAG: LytTR family transcriptional regulator [Lachnospiraceae bacterium]|nr:LytTR family transcriptional regulator [Lachnospiraceae bacterium]MBQ9562005.1 LytTR family transcriptional regulator [Lachnospiraceae bacterium]MBQ9594018.1 LytTR family transcriptional regulator [Lachnospiraceae bacterium]MBR0153446.1 LytTR family transcriptional regulator [Lachnospiraceae bacterium]
MKIRISVPEDQYDFVRDYLEDHGLEISDTAEYMITEASRYPAFLSARNEKREHLRVSTDEVIYIEAFGKEIEIHTMQGTYLAQDRMYQLESLLDPQEFLRISKSVIISRKHVKKIRPSLSMKYILTLSDGTLADVTRSYYSDFRRFFNI